MATCAELIGSPYKTNNTRYEDSVKLVAQKEVCRAFLWLYTGGSKYVGDYLKDKPDAMKMLNKDQKALLQRKEPPTKMDICLLYILLQHTCDLAPSLSAKWNNPDPADSRNLEHSLYKVKMERNSLSHSTSNTREMSDAELDSKLENMRILCSEIICEAGRQSGRHLEIHECIDRMEKGFREVRGMTPKKFAQLAKEEKRKTQEMEENSGRRTPDSYWYSPPLMTCNDKAVQVYGLLRWSFDDGSAPQVILISGDAGAGKTSLCRHIDESWVKEKFNIQDLQDCDLLLFICCRDVVTSDLARLLQEELLPETMSWCDPYSLSKLLNSLKILWIFDGLDEASKAAMILLERMCEAQEQSHIILVTSRPEHSLAFSSQFSHKNIMRVTLSGVDPMISFNMLLQSNMPLKESVKDVVENFTEGFKGLDKAVQLELQNPLKLKLALQDWENICPDLHQGFDLSQLYSKIKDAQMKSLVKKFTKGRLLEREAIAKVEKWFHVLCQIAFDMTHAKMVTDNIIEGPKLKQLEDKCDDLQINSSECLSAFLSHKCCNVSSKCATYSFFHSSQQYFLAAVYVTTALNNSKDILSEAEKLFNVYDLDDDEIYKEYEEENSLEQFYEVFLHLITLLGSSYSDELVRILIRLFSHAIHDESSKWFEVVKKACYNDKFIHNVSEVLPDEWFVNDPCLKAARSLLVNTKPSRIVIQVDKNPRHSSELEPLLYAVGRLQHLVDVQVYLSYHFQKLSSKSTSDKYLELLIHDTSFCSILGFEGHLSDQGYSLLPHMNSCNVLKLKVMSSDALPILCNSIRPTDMESLENLHLTLAVKKISSISTTLPNVIDIDIDLPYMNDNTVEITTKLMSRLSHAYSSITVHNLSPEGAKCFVLQLQGRGVVSKCLFRKVEEEGFCGPVLYGPLPLAYTVLDFMWFWSDWKRLAILQILQAEPGK